MVIQDNAGKKTMGTTSPGNNSGNGMDSGSVAATGTIRKANEPVLYTRLKMIDAFRLNIKLESQQTNPARSDTKTFAAIMVVRFTMAEKSAPVAKKYIRSYTTAAVKASTADTMACAKIVRFTDLQREH
jgi:hypothetical protein